MMCRKLCSILLVVLLAVPGIAYPESIIFPQSVTQIEETAFEECRTIKTVVLPEGITDIGKAAFRGCDNLGNITIPGSVETIGENVFDGCPSDMLITTETGSTAARWAMNSNHDFNAGTKYRALLVGQTYSGRLALDGPENDLPAMENMLESFPGTPFTVTTRKNIQTGAGILDAVQSTFSQADEDDVSLFYYSGHGIEDKDDPDYQGALVGNNGYTYVTASELRAAMDRIPGRKILIIDSCFSGVYARERNSIRTAKSSAEINTTEEINANGSADAFVNSFINAFSAKKRGSDTYSSYFVLAASAEDEESWEAQVNGKYMGLFTHYLTLGAGSSCQADKDRNNVVTIQEAYNFACGYLPHDQHAKVFPSGCNWFGWLRQ